MQSSSRAKLSRSSPKLRDSQIVSGSDRLHHPGSQLILPTILQSSQLTVMMMSFLGTQLMGSGVSYQVKWNRSPLVLFAPFAEQWVSMRPDKYLNWASIAGGRYPRWQFRVHPWITRAQSLFVTVPMEFIISRDFPILGWSSQLLASSFMLALLIMSAALIPLVRSSVEIYRRTYGPQYHHTLHFQHLLPSKSSPYLQMGEVQRLQPPENFILGLHGNLHLMDGLRFQVKLGQMWESQRRILWEQPLLAKYSGSTTLNDRRKL